MKTVLIALSLPALALAACTTGANVAPPPAGFDASATQFTGWVRVRGEEFQLYETEVQLNTGGATPCVSGALPRNLQRASGDMNGQRVRFYGGTRAWSERGNSQLLDLQGSQVSNLCRRDVVIQADRVEVIR
ncbi:MAG: hypothetical protein Q8R97_05440 [Brevundimonas sp.]|uniref:hypothetical protein n=1 Tax=Brevundimonas sp. TaxID=1871086 RepID=UPI002759C2ED|nr:hypothetical protein [Brevundimonas sp.]MDP3400545.1 hypothetical protein [Brevundimonas sp.]MDZ4110594.1 hypothetical protein [Brevundimonas sp.]